MKIFSIVAVWFTISELPRYLLYIPPAMMEHLSTIPNMGNFGVFEVIASTILACIIMFFIYWLCAITFGNNKKAVLISSTVTWLAIFAFYWLSCVSMHTAEWKTF